MKLKLYEIPSAWREVLDDVEVDPETGEILYNEEQLTFIDDVQGKIKNTACWIKEQQVAIDVLSEQIKNLQGRKKSIENKIRWIKDMALHAMESTGIDKVKSPEITVTARTNLSPVYNEGIDPAELYKANPAYVKVEYSLNRSAIRDVIKENGEEIPADLRDVVAMIPKTTMYIR